MPKRKRAADAGDELDGTPRRTRRSAPNTQDVGIHAAGPPSARKSILRDTPSKPNGTIDVGATPKSLRKVLFATPAKAQDEEVTEADEEADGETTPTAVRNDRSACRKSQKILQKPVVRDDDSEVEDGGQSEAIAREILGEQEGEEGSEDETIEPSSAANTPSKTGRPRGRPKGSKNKPRERTPTPPSDLPPHELYFFQNRAGGNQTSANTLPSQLLLNHDDYFSQIKGFKDTHEQDLDRLKRLHSRAFSQWMFELDEGFNICLYGYGSKRDLALSFAHYLYSQRMEKASIVVVNGYTPALSIRDILTTLGTVILPKHAKLPAQPQAIFNLVSSSLIENPPTEPIMLIINSMDHVNLRKASTQSILAQLAAHPSLSLLATCDTPSFPLLWDIALTRQLRFLYHDTTTFEPYRVEIDTVEDVNTLLGRGGRRLGGKDGVGYVLKSLPENARNLFRILVAEQLALADTEAETMIAPQGEHTLDIDDILGAEDEDEALAAVQSTPSRRAKKNPKSRPPPRPPTVTLAPEGVEYRTLYHKAVEEFVCSSELNFRTLLKEFHDHQMIESRKDAMGTERLVVPFRREELEGILEELV